MPSIYLKEYSLEDLGLRLVRGSPDLGMPAMTRDRTPWPGRMGSVPSPFATVDSRVLSFEVEKKVATAAERTALIDQYADLLAGLVPVRFADQPTRCLRGIARVFEVNIPSPSWVNLDPRIRVEIECFTATKWAEEPTSRTLSTTPVQIPCGTAGHGGLIYVTGAISTLQSIKYRNVAGILLGDVQFTPSLAAGEIGVINLTDEQIFKIDNTGVKTTVTTAWLGASAVWFKPSPRDGYRDLGVWPTVESTVAGLYVFRLNYKT